MGQRIHAPFLAALLAATLAGPVIAQTNRWVDPPSNSRRLQGGEQTRDLNFLFEALKVAPDDSSARSVEERIWALWLSSGGDTTDLLMSRVKTAVEAKDLDLALKLLDAIIDFRPEYVEGWDRRATIYYLKKEYGRAVSDISQVLAREPRHFGALFGLGLIMQEFGDDKRALDVFRRALAIDPRLQRVPDLVKTLTEKIEGRDI